MKNKGLVAAMGAVLGLFILSAFTLTNSNIASEDLKYQDATSTEILAMYETSSTDLFAEGKCEAGKEEAKKEESSKKESAKKESAKKESHKKEGAKEEAKCGEGKESGESEGEAKCGEGKCGGQ